jgi:hypothetical protein
VKEEEDPPKGVAGHPLGHGGGQTTPCIKKKKKKKTWVEPPSVHLCFNVLKQSIETEEGRGLHGYWQCSVFYIKRF